MSDELREGFCAGRARWLRSIPPRNGESNRGRPHGRPFFLLLTGIKEGVISFSEG